MDARVGNMSFPQSFVTIALTARLRDGYNLLAEALLNGLIKGRTELIGVKAKNKVHYLPNKYHFACFWRAVSLSSVQFVVCILIC